MKLLATPLSTIKHVLSGWLYRGQQAAPTRKIILVVNEKGITPLHQHALSSLSLSVCAVAALLPNESLPGTSDD